MKIESTNIKDLLIITPTIYEDERGYFFESYNVKQMSENGIKTTFVQDNQSFSKKGTLRGLHYQIKHQQTKLVRVVKGEVFDVAVDLRKNSTTYGKWYGTILSDTNMKQLYIPKGFAHGFLTLSDSAIFCYKCDDFYHPNDEGGIYWDDETLKINWPKIEKITISEKDKHHPQLDEIKIKL